MCSLVIAAAWAWPAVGLALRPLTSILEPLESLRFAAALILDGAVMGFLAAALGLAVGVMKRLNTSCSALAVAVTKHACVVPVVGPLLHGSNTAGKVNWRMVLPSEFSTRLNRSMSPSVEC